MSQIRYKTYITYTTYTLTCTLLRTGDHHASVDRVYISKRKVTREDLHGGRATLSGGVTLASGSENSDRLHEVV